MGSGRGGHWWRPAEVVAGGPLVAAAGGSGRDTGSGRGQLVAAVAGSSRVRVVAGGPLVAAVGSSGRVQVVAGCG